MRKAIGKKKEGLMAELKERFIEGAVRYGKCNRNIAENVFSLIEKFAGYGFNKAHSLVYSMLSFKTAWLKLNYPVEFFASLVNSKITNKDLRIKYLKDGMNNNIYILNPDINSSEYYCSVEDGKLRVGFGCVEGVGETHGKSIINRREKEGLFTSIFQISETEINKNVLVNLTKAGAFDNLGLKRWDIVENAKLILDFKQDKSQMFLFDNSYESRRLPAMEKWSTKRMAEEEKEVLGINISDRKPLAIFLNPITTENIERIAPLLGGNFNNIYLRLPTREKLYLKCLDGIDLDKLSDIEKIVGEKGIYIKFIN